MNLHTRPTAKGACVRQGARQARPSRTCRPCVTVRAAAAKELEEIDPITGQVINKLAPIAPKAGQQVTVGGLSWAYRQSTLASGTPRPNTPPVLLLHGIGSSSYSYRNSLGLLGADNVTAFAPDWIGHGDSAKPLAGAAWDYSEAAYMRGLGDLIAALGVQQPLALCVQGYVLSQYALKYALEHPGQIDRLLILNTPLSRKSALRPELAPYKAPLPFMRPGKGARFDGMMFNASGSPYAIQRRDAEVYGQPYADPAASAAISAIMDKVDFSKLLASVDEGFMTWRKPSMLLFGPDDPFLDLGAVFEFLETKRTNMKMSTIPARLGHMPQEDFPEAVHDVMMRWLTVDPELWNSKSTTDLKMTKRGVAAS